MKLALNHFGVREDQIRLTVRSDLTRAAIADRIFRETTVSQEWIALKLGMKSAPKVCQKIRRFRKVPKNELSGLIKKWTKVNIFLTDL